jgi:hypothetical protein
MKISSIDLGEHLDEEGDALLKITVVFEADESDFDSARLIELPRLVMPKLEAAKENAFPLFSFVSKSDLRKSKAEAA